MAGTIVDMTNFKPTPRNPLLHLVVIVLLGSCVYSNTFHAPFQFDEKNYLIGFNGGAAGGC